jgi:hypothetical protein
MEYINVLMPVVMGNTMEPTKPERAAVVKVSKMC